MELRLVGGDKGRVESTNVVVALTAGQPRDRRVARAIDRAIDDLTGRHVHDADDRFLRAALGELVGEQIAFLAGLPGVERGEARGVELHRVDEHALGSVGVDRAQHGELLARVTAHEESAIASERRRADTARGRELQQPGAPVVERGPLRALLVEER